MRRYESCPVFSEEDHRILESYKTVVEGLADYMGEGYELVLHSLEDIDHSVVKIINGHHTGRKEGAPITDLALTMLSRIEEENRAGYISYFSRNKKGEPMKSSTIVISGEGGKTIGLLCINFYMNTPMAELLSSFQVEKTLSEPAVTEIFAEDTKELVFHSVNQIKRTVDADQRILPSNKNREIVNQLWNQNIFELKDAVAIVAQELGLSPNTVYLHLRKVKKDGK